MSTRTLRGLAAGAGAAAVLFAGAAGASAIDGQPQESHWEDYFAGQGYENVSCEESVVSGDPGVLTLNVAEDTWGTYLEDGNDWIGVVIKVANDYDVKAWSGYGDYVFEGEVPGNSEGNITHAYICQATAADDDDDDDDGPKCPKTPPGNGTSTTTPPVTTTTPPVTETTPPVTETTPPSTSTTTPDTPGVAPTDLGPTQTTGIFSLFAIAAGLLLAAARLLRGARH